MYDLTIVKQGNGAYIDSREVAALIGKRHDNLLRDIVGYIKIMRNSNALKIEDVDFFLENSYLDAKGETRTCYLLSKMACELVANKLTGEKGVLFTVAYVTKFNEMEAAERAAIAALQVPRLGEYNAAARLIVRAMREAGATPEQIMEFLKEVYAPLGINIRDDVYDTTADSAMCRHMYNSRQIAEMHGMYTINGNPHSWAVSAILNDHIRIDDKHTSAVTIGYMDGISVNILYDDFAVQAVEDWIIENGFPDEIPYNGRNYFVCYKF